MPLSPNAQQRVGEQSRTLWEGFHDFYELDEYSVLDESLRKERFLDFFQHCVEMHAPNDCASITAAIKYDDLTAMRQGEPSPSWLTYSYYNGHLTVTIVLDRAILSGASNFTTDEVDRVILRLILHETGHLLHLEELLNPRNRSPYVMDASPIHESEAWWFCHSIIGLVISNWACLFKDEPKPQNPPIWSVRF